MDKFTASKGITVAADEGVTFGSEYGFTYYGVSSKQFQALREYFRAERDKELGRWRWPENPDYVVYTQGAGWIVMSERSANSKHYSFREHAAVGTSILAQAMRAYFEAHPERKPWEDAKEGDVWLLTVNGEEEALLFRHDRTFISRDGDEFAPEGSYITAGHRIWPEVSDADR